MRQRKQGPKLEGVGQNRIGAHPVLSRVVTHPNTDSYRVKTVTGDMKSLTRQFCATPAPNSTQLWAGPDYEGPGVWGPENEVYNLAVFVRPTVIPLKAVPCLQIQ